jgi:hypothetical protein
MKQIVLILLPCILLAGCTTRTPSQRIAAEQATYDSWPAEVQATIAKGEIAIGFTPEQVLMAWGKPDEKTSEVNAEADIERWIYLKDTPAFSIGIGTGHYGGNVGVGGSVGTTIGGDSSIVGLVRFENNRVISFDRKKD